MAARVVVGLRTVAVERDRAGLLEPCPFCLIVAGDAPATLVREWPDAVAFVPLNPVAAGHVLVVPRAHVPNFAADPVVSASVMFRVADLAGWLPTPMNVITSRGAAATQTVHHLHFHLVPRREGDGLALPWTGQTSKEPT
jgi:histidine triad (HIT) family protein